jgi:hypothetical protein
VNCVAEEPISFADNVRVRVTPVTEAAGVAGLHGQVYGVTTPSVTGVEVIGEVKDDTAVNVFFAEQNASHWFTPDLLEFVDHAPGTEIRVANSPTKSVRTEDGEWQVLPVETSPARGVVAWFARVLGIGRA